MSGLGGRLPLLGTAALGPGQRQLYDVLVGWQQPFITRDNDGALIGPYNPSLYLPEVGHAFLALQQAQQLHAGLAPRLREVVILTVGAIWAAAYELYAHRALALRAGLTLEEVEALSNGRPPSSLSSAEQSAWQFTVELVRDRQVAERTYIAADEAIGQKGLVALTFLTGTYCLTSALLTAFEVPAPAAGEPLV